MSELDLIPVRYHRRRRFQSWVQRAAVVYLVVALSMVGARSVLGARIKNYGREIENLNVERERAEGEQQRLTQLSVVRDALQQRLEVLEGLRGGVEAKRMFSVVDDSLDANVRFRRWRFRRAGEIVDEAARAVETGYFIVLPRESADEPKRTWLFETHMEILADSEDHSALANFVRRLSQKREIESARILSTQVRNATDSSRVEFELAVVVRSSR